jgi:hypothetical protein
MHEKTWKWYARSNPTALAEAVSRDTSPMAIKAGPSRQCTNLSTKIHKYLMRCHRSAICSLASSMENKRAEYGVPKRTSSLKQRLMKPNNRLNEN